MPATRVRTVRRGVAAFGIAVGRDGRGRTGRPHSQDTVNGPAPQEQGRSLMRCCRDCGA